MDQNMHFPFSQIFGYPGMSPQSQSPLPYQLYQTPPVSYAQNFDGSLPAYPILPMPPPPPPPSIPDQPFMVPLMYAMEIQAKEKTNKKKFGYGQKKRFGLGHQNREAQPQFYCETCKITCAGNQTYKEHLEGKAHKKKEALSKGTNSLSLPRNKVSFKCDACNVTCTGRDTYDAHVKGSKHTKTIATLRKMNLPVPTGEPTLIPPKDMPSSTPGAPVKKIVGVTGTKFVGGTKLSTTGTEEPISNEIEEALLSESNVKPVGEEFIEEQRDGLGKLITYNCKLCDCKFNDPNAKMIHLKGRRHRLQYKAKVNPDLQVEVKFSGPTWKRHQRDMGFYPPPPTMFRPPMGPIRPLFPMPYCSSVETRDDRHVMSKVNAIMPSKEQQNNFELLVNMVEKTLKSVSDQLAAEEQKPEIKNDDANAAEPERMLKGVMRVGLLAKNLLLKMDTEVNLVVLCSKIPTVSLLQKVVELFPKNAEKEESDTLEVVCKQDESCFIVKLKEKGISCRVTLTCVSIREAALGDGSTTGATITDVPNALPVQSCLKALAELRHAKWFQVKCAPLHSAHVTLRIIRDISHRVKTWSPLTEWAMELLTEKVLSSIDAQLNSGDAIRRIFEAISGGILLNKNSRLLDPCEKEQIDVLAHLIEQEREDITSSAQHALRLISFNQIYKILGIERLPETSPSNGSAERKRPRESSNESNDESGSLKKEKVDQAE